MANTYDTYKDSGIAWIGEIPSEWKVLPHKRVMRKIKEIQEHYQGENIISLTMNGVIIRDLEAGGKMPASFDGYQKVFPGNLLQCLFDIDVTPRCVGLIKNEGLSSPAYSQFCMDSMSIAPYYDYLLRYMDDYKTLLHLSKNLRSSLTETDFGQISTIRPSVTEQNSIASFLDEKCMEIDSLVVLQEEMISELQAYKQSVITEAVTKGLDPNAKMKDSGVEWIGEIPEGWNVCRFKAVAKVKANLVHPDDYLDMPQVAPDCIEKGSGRIIKHQTVKEANVISDNHLFYKGQIVYSKIRPTLNKVIIAPFDGLCCADMYPIETSQNQNYFLYQMLSSVFNDQVSVVVQDRVKMPKINKEELDQILIVVPPIKEQEDIVNFILSKVSEIDSLISLKQEKIQELKDYKKSIIYEYVTGKKRVI